MLRELLGQVLRDEDVEVIGEYADAAGLQADCTTAEFSRRAGGRPVIAVAGERQRVVLQRIAPVVLPARKAGRGDLVRALRRMADDTTEPDTSEES